VVYIVLAGCRWKTVDCAILWAMTGWGGVPQQRVGAQRMVPIRRVQGEPEVHLCRDALRAVNEEIRG